MLALGLKRPRKLKLIQQPDEESLIAAERELLVSGFLLYQIDQDEGHNIKWYLLILLLSLF